VCIEEDSDATDGGTLSSSFAGGRRDPCATQVACELCGDDDKEQGGTTHRRRRVGQ
jgi:hypothetical protein